MQSNIIYNKKSDASRGSIEKYLFVIDTRGWKMNSRQTDINNNLSKSFS